MKTGVLPRRQIKAQAARYTKFVGWSDEDQCFIGRCPEIMAGGVHGRDEAKVYAELCQAVEEMIELIHTDGLALPDHWRQRNSAANLSCALNRRCTAAWPPKPWPPAKASIASAPIPW